MRTARVCAEGVPTPAIDAIVVPAALLGGMDVVHRPVKSGVPSGAILGSCWLRSVPCKRGRSNRVSDGKEPQVSPCQRKGSLELVCAQIRGFRGPVKPTATKGIALRVLSAPGRGRGFRGGLAEVLVEPVGEDGHVLVEAGPAVAGAGFHDQLAGNADLF